MENRPIAFPFEVSIDDGAPSKPSGVEGDSTSTEGAKKRFKMHMDAMIRKSCHDLRQSIEFLCHEYLDSDEVEITATPRDANGSKLYAGQPDLSSEVSSMQALRVGEQALYFSRSNGGWIPAIVKGHCTDAAGQLLSYSLDVQSAAEPDRVKAQAVNSSSFTFGSASSPSFANGASTVAPSLASPRSFSMEAGNKVLMAEPKGAYGSQLDAGQPGASFAKAQATLDHAEGNGDGELIRVKSKQKVLRHDSSFEDHLEQEKGGLVKNALMNAEGLHARQGFKHADGGKPKHALWWWTIHDMHLRDLFLEPSMGFMIVMNVAFMGVGMDADPDSIIPLGVEVLFCLFFLVEFGLKLIADGCKPHLLGDNARFNWFNALLVLFDGLGIALTFAGAAADSIQPDGAPSASLLRAVRIMRLTRVLRMLKWAVFADLCAMMQGMLSGMPTLVWSMVLFFCPIYVFSLLFREALGRGQVPFVTEMFDNVPRSIFTVFRCSFGDCSHPAGVPIFEYVQDHYGWFWSLIYAMFSFFITIGLFNVISAIFVEATMRSAADLDYKTKQSRLQSDDLWSVQVASLLRRLVRRYPPEPNLLFTISLQEHISEPVNEKLQKARALRDQDRMFRGLAEMPDAEWNERLLITDTNGTPMEPEVLAQSVIPESLFPITAKLQAPKAFHELSEDELRALDESDTPMSEEFAGISKLAYGASAIDTWVKDPIVIHALDELDIDPQDHDKLSDLLDPQNDGSIPVLDLIDGIRRLRGFPLRSDIVCIDLMVRQSQLTMHEHKTAIATVQEGTEELQSQVEELHDSLQRIESTLRSLTR